MKYEIVIEQRLNYKDEVYGETDSYDDALSLMNLIMSMCKEVKVSIIATNREENKEE